MKLETFLSFHPCRDARDYVATFPTVREAWDACERPDWLLWLAGRLPDTRNAIVQFARECAERAKNSEAGAARAAAAWAARTERAWQCDRIRELIELPE